MNWNSYVLLVPKVGRSFLVCAPSVERAAFVAKYHAAIVAAAE